MQDADDTAVRPRGPESEQGRDGRGVDPWADGACAQASERRSQAENRAVALKRLRLELAIAIRRPIDLGELGAYAPSTCWLNRCRGGRIVVSPDHEEFPALLAEAT